MSAFATFKFRGNTFEYEGRIYPFEGNRAFASITLNHVISIKCHVISGQYGHFISWPSYKFGDEYKNYIYAAPELKDELAVIEDLRSTGKSSAAAVDAVREAGGVVSDVISIFTYGMKKADDLFAEKECMTYSVSNFDALISVASEKKYIKKKDIDKICEWIVNPEKWGKKYGFEK